MTELQNINSDPQVANLRTRGAALHKDQATLDRAVQSAEELLAEARATLDEVETNELVGSARPKDVTRAQSAVDEATSALRDATAAAENNRRLLSKLIGQQAVIEDRARARVRPEIEKALKAALAEHAARARAFADSQKALDALRESVFESFGAGTDYTGGTRLRGWSHSVTGSPALLPLTNHWKTLDKEVERFVTALNVESIRV